MVNPRRIVAIGVASVAVAGSVLCGLTWHRSRKVATAFSHIAVGQSEQEVAALLGQPEWIAAPLPSHWCDDSSVAAAYATAQDRECVRQWGYRDFPGPACFTVCFGGDGRVVSTYRYVSP